MAKTSTFTGVIRSAGGDSTKAVTPGVVEVVVPFYIADPTAANTTAVTRGASNTANVILPPNAIITEIGVSADATGGTNPTFDMGWINVDDSTDFDVDGLVAEGDADAGDSIFNMATATAGDDVGVIFETANNVRITGGVGASAPTGGTISGYIKYHVDDNGEWAN
jgi:hypothetical protein